MEFAALIPIFSAIINRIFPDPAVAAQAKLEMQNSLNAAQAEKDKADAAEMASQAQVVSAEVSSTSWLAANWRPVLMFMITIMIANQWIISPILVPILGHFGFTFAMPAFPSDAWNLLTVGIGGYIGKEAVIAHHEGKLAVAQVNAGAGQTMTSRLYFDALRAVKGGNLSQVEVDDANKVLSKLNIS